MNTSNVKITADMFVSLVFDGWERNEDGSINLKGFLEIKDTVPANVANAKLGGQASYEITLAEDEECSFSPAWYKLDKYSHWHVCECGNKSELGDHDFMWVIDKPQVGDQTGLKHQECKICGYKKAAITIYPESSTTPPEVDPPVDDPIEEPTEELSFFEMIWQAILNFLRSIFPGLFPAEE